jgi:hypothetical protein
MTVLRGHPGAGKSICLSGVAVGLGAKDRGQVAPRDGTKRGEIECVGVMLGVNASRITRNGEPEVASVESFSLDDLIYPPLKDADARERHGIKALLRMADQKADPELFYQILGGKEAFEKIVGPDATKAADVVDLAIKIKRGIEQHARQLEDQAEQEEGKAAADRNAGDGLDLTAETDPNALRRALEDAAGIKSRIDEQCRAAVVAQQRAATGRKNLEAAGNPPSIASARFEADRTRGVALEASDNVVKLRRELAAAESAMREAETIQNAAVKAVQSAEQQSAAIAGWQDAIEAAGKVTPPSAEEIEAAAEMLEDARRTDNQAAVIRAAKDRIERAKQHQKAAAELRMTANRLRQNAKETDDVLSRSVNSPRFFVEGGILMGRLPDGKIGTYYRFSDGERAIIATEEKLERARAQEPTAETLAIITLGQRIAQDLPPSIHERLAQMAYNHNSCLVTALVSDSPLHCEVWQPKEVTV